MKPSIEKENILVGEEFSIEEMPTGCVLSEISKFTGEYCGATVQIRSPQDAAMVIESLSRMLNIQFPDFRYGVEVSEDEPTPTKSPIRV